jgi:hypothetical protein
MDEVVKQRGAKRRMIAETRTQKMLGKALK